MKHAIAYFILVLVLGTITIFGAEAPETTIDNRTIVIAQEQCRLNGGLRSIRPNWFNKQKRTVRCDNGATFVDTYVWKEPLTKEIKTDTIVAPKN